MSYPGNIELLFRKTRGPYLASHHPMEVRPAIMAHLARGDRYTVSATRGGVEVRLSLEEVVAILSHPDHAYQSELHEIYREPGETYTRGGDCDDWAILATALAQSQGYRAEPLLIELDGTSTTFHAVALLWHGSDYYVVDPTWKHYHPEAAHGRWHARDAETAIRTYLHEAGYRLDMTATADSHWIVARETP